MGSSERRFEGKVTLVTGGASGIGRATCIRLAEDGAQVFATDVNSAGLAETEAVVKDAGGAIQAGSFDVALRASCFESVQAAVDAAVIAGARSMQEGFSNSQIEYQIKSYINSMISTEESSLSCDEPEIDFPEDVVRAKKDILPAIRNDFPDF